MQLKEDNSRCWNVFDRVS